MDAGLDSLGAVEFRSNLESKFSLQLPPTLVFDFPTLSAIVGYLDSTLAGQQSEQGPTVPSTSAAAGVPAALQSPVMHQAGFVAAISATYGTFPEPSAVVVGGGLLQDVISVVPLERYDCEVQLTSDLPARFGGFLSKAQVRPCGPAGSTCSPRWIVPLLSTIPDIAQWHALRLKMRLCTLVARHCLQHMAWDM